MRLQRMRRFGSVAILASVLAVVTAMPAAAGPVPAGLTGVDGRQLIVDLPGNVDTTTGSTVQSGHRGWFFILQNNSTSTVTNPTINVGSGYDPSLFSANCSGPLGSFPFITNQAALAPGQAMNSGLCSTVPVSFTTGFDSARRVTPLEVPPGGGRQHVAITMTLTDAKYVPANVIKVSVLTDLPGESIVCSTASAPPPSGQVNCTSSHVDWSLLDQPIGTSVQFAVSVDVPNTSTQPILHKSRVWTLAAPSGSFGATGPANSSSIADSSLDGGTPGAGMATYSVNEATPAWSTILSDNFWVDYTPFLATCAPSALGDQDQGGNNQGC